MSNSKKIKKTILNYIVKEAFDAFIEGYKRGKKFKQNEIREESQQKQNITPSIITLAKEDSDKIIEGLTSKNKESDKLFGKINELESDIRSLKSQIGVLIQNEKRTQEQTVTLITTVEEMLHSLEECGIIPTNDLLVEEFSSNSDEASNAQIPMNDVMRTDKFFVNDVIASGNKKFDLN